MTASLLPLIVLLAGAAGAQTLEQRAFAAADALKEQLLAARRDFHMHPELSNREERTGRVIAEKLRALGFDEVRTGVARHGVVGVLKGGKTGPVVAWRADMDALPIEAAVRTPHKSRNPGVHHACGHDAHMAVALAVAEVLAKVRADIPGTVKFLFQPAEEGPPSGEEGGAPLMIKEGALDNPRPQAIFGLHISTWHPAGTIGYSYGPALASADSFHLTIKGKRVHAASPHLGIDTVVVASECVMALQTIRSRRIDNSEPMVFSIGSIHGGNRNNILADEVKMEGTLRTLDEGIREKVRGMVRQTLDGCTMIHGASYQMQWDEPHYPVTFNDPALVKESLGGLERAFGAKNVMNVKPITGAEDFSYYQKVIPGFFWFLGASNPSKGITAAHHTADFDIDEDVLLPGVKAAAAQLLDYLAKH